MGLEPIWLPTRPSNVRVYLFRHGRILTFAARLRLYYNSTGPFEMQEFFDFFSKKVFRIF